LDYVNLSKNETRNLNKIEDLVKSQEEIFIWGAGNYTMRLLENSALSQCNITGFVDKDPHKQGEMINGISVYGTEKILDLPAKCTIVVCSAIYSGEIVNEMNSMNIMNRIVVL